MVVEDVSALDMSTRLLDGVFIEVRHRLKRSHIFSWTCAQSGYWSRYLGAAQLEVEQRLF